MEAVSLPNFLIRFLSLPRFLLIFTMFISWLAFSSSADECEPFKCVDHVFEYPFGQKNSSCGDPALQLECDHDMPVLDISGNQYYVLQPLSYRKGDPNHSMTIIYKWLWGDECSQRKNWPQNQSHIQRQFRPSNQFHITGEYTNIAMGMQCEQGTQGEQEMKDLLDKVALKLGCNDSYLFPNLKVAQDYCDLVVQVPVKTSEISSLRSNPNQIIKKGFDITWSVSKICEYCESRKGICIYDTNTSAFRQCNAAGPHKNQIAIPLGCSLAGLALAATVVLLFIFYVKRRKPTSSRCLLADFGCSQRREAGYLTVSLPIFRYDELEQATNFFHEDNELGDGGCGSVFLGKLQDGRTVAIKRLYQENPRRVQQFMNEIHILSSLNHPNLVRLYGCTDPQSPVLLLVYEFIPNGTLFDHLHGSRRTPKGLDWEIRLNIAIETAQALAFLHSVEPPVFHRDVKSTNILLDENFRAKVADFGLSRLVPLNVSHVTTAPQGTPGYVDPEYHHCFQLTDKSDVYSFGVVLVEIISAKVAVDVNRNRNEISLADMALDKIRKAALHEFVDPDLKSETKHEVKAMIAAVAELAYQCLAGERDCRPDMKEVAARLENIKQHHGISTREQQKSLRKESSDLKSVVPPLSPTSVGGE